MYIFFYSNWITVRWGRKNIGPGDQEILSRRQKEALTFKSNGLRDKQIAERMNISKSAVQIHLRAACEKLKANNTTHGVALAIANNQIEIPKHPEIADLEHHAFSYGVYEAAETYLLNQFKKHSSAELSGNDMEDYIKFLQDLISDVHTE